MRIRFTHRKTGETMTIPGAPPEALVQFSVLLGAYGVLVSSLPEAGPDVPICRCLYQDGERLTNPDCDFHGTPTSTRPVNAFAEALFQAAVEQMQADKRRLQGGDL